ncbi:hypothetical protein L6452_01118 [Arctium lappa]|uniref:Uncharacterized protein n=1 Tax=Arctium lappa TaxID=4217 RepID=A0ACB9FGN4_ARCLA|nr:hypothetical protein L6452_01118 [Arctium lappa]
MPLSLKTSGTIAAYNSRTSAGWYFGGVLVKRAQLRVAMVPEMVVVPNPLHEMPLSGRKPRPLMALYTWRSLIGFGSLTFGRHAFGRTMNSVDDRGVVRIVAETYIKISAIAEAFPHVPSRISRFVFASMISASGITLLFTSETISDTEQDQFDH